MVWLPGPTSYSTGELSPKTYKRRSRWEQDRAGPEQAACSKLAERPVEVHVARPKGTPPRERRASCPAGGQPQCGAADAHRRWLWRGVLLVWLWKAIDPQSSRRRGCPCCTEYIHESLRLVAIRKATRRVVTAVLGICAEFHEVRSI